MENFARTGPMAEMCHQVKKLTWEWDTDQRVAIDAVQPLQEAWLAIVYRNPIAGPHRGLAFDLNDLAAGFEPELSVSGLAGEIVQSFFIEPGDPGRQVAHPWLKGLNEKFGPLTWSGDVAELPSGQPAK